MRFISILTFLSAAAVTLAAPVARDAQSALDQAAVVLDQLNFDLAAQISDLDKTSGLELSQPFDYDVPLGISKAFHRAIYGISRLPSFPSTENKPEYVAHYFLPLVDTTTEVTFAYIKELAEQSRKYFNNPEYTKLEPAIDRAIYEFVLAVNAKFQGYTCALANRVGADTLAGQALKEVSDHTFQILFDAINPGNCK